MEPKHKQLESMCHQFLDSLMSGKHSTLCLNIAEPGFEPGEVAKSHLEGQGEVTCHDEPSPTEFATILEGLEGRIAVVNFADLDKKPKQMDMLFEHVQKPEPPGKLVVVSRDWNSDNTEKERELRRHCLFYQQNLPRKPRTAR
jgi:hypothetical protein